MVRLKYENGSVTGVEKFMFATASLMGERASWTLRSQLQRNWRTLAKEFSIFNVTVFQVKILTSFFFSENLVSFLCTVGRVCH